ncbi:leucine-rich repeat-containing protein 15 [Amyelois transitella]|uniref:leucine-rich repeat-containing protein 15 n=1 Tax=Amyelois transitella TaxID=680683 RepID=UPI002990111B|nr:leucine-rich repeat-containing protein 15 [Amyelois transitella]
MSIWIKLLITVILETIVTAKLICSKKGVTDIVCTAGNSDYELERGVVSDQNGITGIHLKSCRITQIKLEAFKGLPALEYLDLSHNSISNLDLGVLDDTQNLKSLNLSFNSIKSLPLGLFDQEPNLEVLDLRGNSIKNLTKGLFAPLKKLRHLDVSNNFLVGRELSPDIFENNKLIKFMDISRNDLSDTPENLFQAFTQIDFLNVDRCFLDKVPAFTTKTNMKTMKHLMLSTNHITQLDDPKIFLNLESIEIINLAKNLIESISENIFKSLKKIKMIILRDNNLRSIPDTLFKGLPKLVNLHLQNNMLESLPVNAFRNSRIKNLNVGGNKITFLIDNFCLELKNSGTNLKKFMFTNNPWQCPCLLDVLVEMRRMGIEYNPDKYDGQQKVCVQQDQYCHRHLESNSVYIDLYQELVELNP